eukprot:TRINITY_DN71171_c0_g1_i1.p1 TRINITY_DN71171_c0_g1~~TRINITY_DN71171_c0_g1_i1.p1  ORF type:complete len:284 (-),score=46.09 TRINITY_DN71171_c0_g1_i1:54-851(-)
MSMTQLPRSTRKRTLAASILRFLALATLVWFVCDKSDESLFLSTEFSTSQTQLSRRQGLVASFGTAVALALSGETPAEAIFGLFEDPKMIPYTVLGVFNISTPPSFKILAEQPRFIVWSGDRIQPVDQMFVSIKATNYANLSEALGSDINTAGEKIAQRRPGIKANAETVSAALLEALEDPNFQGLDIYQFEFESSFAHELALYSIIRKDGQNYICNICLRTPSLNWIDRRDIFREILATFSPLEQQPNRTRTVVLEDNQTDIGR